LKVQADLHINQKIIITREGITEWFNSSIQDIQGNVINIGIPYSKEFPLVLRQEDKVKVIFTTRNGSYAFNTRVTGKVEDNINLYQLAYPGEIYRVQQRKFVRLQVLLDIQYSVVGRDDKTTEFNKATVVDLSGNGIRIAVREKIKENTRLVLKFSLPLQQKEETLELLARVIRQQVAETGRGLYHLGLTFEEITKRQQDLIVRFIFEKMAQQKRLR